MQIIQKIIFLYKSNSNFEIFYKFLIKKLKNIYFKKKIKEQKKGHVKFLKKKIITHDYFSSHAFNFNEILKSYKKFEYLEIGSFEGNSSMFVAKNFPDSKLRIDAFLLMAKAQFYRSDYDQAINNLMDVSKYGSSNQKEEASYWKALCKWKTA